LWEEVLVTAQQRQWIGIACRARQALEIADVDPDVAQRSPVRREERTLSLVGRALNRGAEQRAVDPAGTRPRDDVDPDRPDALAGERLAVSAVVV
jgi:hypothetical protein